MNLLLDTHIILWWLADDPALPLHHRELIAAPDNLCHVSAASIWEIGIKSGLGKLTIKGDYLAELRREGFLELPITWKHSQQAGQLPAHHADPFDRMLIAQALADELLLLSVDPAIRQYQVRVL